MVTFREQLKGRFAALGVVVLVVLGALGVRLWSMQVLSADQYVAAAASNSTREISLPAPRGRILDDQGRALVTNRSVISVDRSVECLARHDHGGTTIGRHRSVGPRHPKDTRVLQAAAARPARPARRHSARDGCLSHRACIRVPRCGSRGVCRSRVPVRLSRRARPGIHRRDLRGAARLFDHPRGDESDDIVGKTGVEAEYDTVLEGEKGFQQLEVDNMGRVVSVLGRALLSPARTSS